MVTGAMYVLVLLSALLGMALADQVQITNSWNGGFQGKFTINPPQDLHGWKIQICFSKQIDQLEVSLASIKSVFFPFGKSYRLCVSTLKPVSKHLHVFTNTHPDIRLQ